MSKNNSSAARADVLTFYEKLPFNDNESPEEAAELIKKVNNVKYIYPNENDLYYAENILEIGCGTGWLSNSIAYYYGSKVTAVDFNPVAIETAKKVADKLVVNVNFICADLFNFQCEQKDLVISNGVLHHTSNAIQGGGGMY